MTHFTRQPKLSGLVRFFLQRRENAARVSEYPQQGLTPQKRLQKQQRRFWRGAGEFLYCLCFLLMVAAVLYAPLIIGWLTGGK
jgi:hypothetical protein